MADRLHPSRSFPQGMPAVLYIGGFGRSGSTLLERVLEAQPSVVSLGEMVHLWTRGLRENELCECGSRFYDCSFWSAVGERAFGGWSAVDTDKVLGLLDAVDRQRRVFKTVLPVRRRTRQQILEYTGYYRAVYAAAASVTGAAVVVDSSKHASLALALVKDPRVDLRLLHLVRDSVAVAYSWSREVARPETAEAGEMMTRYSSFWASMLWMSNNLLVQLARLSDRPVQRLRYEDFVKAPNDILRRVWGALALPGHYSPDLSAPGGIDIPAGHSIGGNPMRFRKEPLVIKSDEVWRTRMDPRQRRAVKVLTAPVRYWLGYSRS